MPALGASDQLTLVVEHDGAAVEDQLVLAADRVAVGDEAGVVARPRGQHLFALAVLAEMERRRGDVRDELRTAESEVGNPEGADRPNKKYFDPRGWLYLGEQGITERLLTKDGVPVKLGARALDMLIALISSPNEVVSKKDLVSRVWPDVVAGVTLAAVGVPEVLGYAKIAGMPLVMYCFLKSPCKLGPRRLREM